MILTFFTTISIHAVTRIMPLGDSITYDNNHNDVENPRPTSLRTGYRSHLWYGLKAAGYSADFVGSRVAGEKVEPPFDPDNEGHPGWTSYDIAENVYSYLEHSKPDMILLHIGTNDHRTSIRGVESILNEIDHYERNNNHRIHVLVALIIDRQAHDPIISVFNNNLRNLIALRRSNGDIVTLVDMNGEAGLTHDDYADNTHPNDNGYKKMANVWLKAIQTPFKPFNTSLSAYPTNLVDSSNIISVKIDEAQNKVEFTTKIPDNGITF
jgi:hypothetical protein